MEWVYIDCMLSSRDQLQLKKTLSYANGYRELGMFDDALQELSSLEDSLSQRNECLQMYLAICMEAKRWKDALPVANRLASVETSDPGNLINLAYVTRRAKSLEGARVILENAAKRFPNEAIIHYNLGCYACSAEELDTATSYLAKAFELDPHYIEVGMDDEDLVPLRAWIESTVQD